MLLLLLLGLLAPARAVEVVPLFKLDLMGGQFFYEGANTSFSGNADLLAAPSIQLDEDNVIIPTLSSQYRRTREVRELVGGGFLTQESLATLLNVKWVRQLDDRWFIKPGIGYKNELLNETEEEALGNGLFDYHKISASFEAERKTENSSFRPAVAVYAVRYYHYHTLSSGDEELGAEINAGDRVLDFDAYDASLAYERQLGEATILGLSALGSYRPFRDQNIVTNSGSYIDKGREDFYLLGAVSLQQRLPDLGRLQSAAAITLSYVHLLSNQNNYDASRTQFNGDYYDYGEATAAPQLALRWAEKLSASVGYEFARRHYPQRPVQTQDGSYSTNAKIWTETQTVTASLSYPLYKSLLAKAQAAYRFSLSNMSYEGSYKYNYESAHYFAGLGLNF
jgi:hypothetical protein